MQDFLNNLISLISARFSLFIEELGQVKDNLILVIFWGMGVLLFGTLGLISLSALFVVYMWPIIGLWSLLFITVIFWFSTALLIYKIWRVIDLDKLKFKNTVNELRLDREIFRSKEES